jgi:RimJ/RimL family protein N-acetyltransferase
MSDLTVAPAAADTTPRLSPLDHARFGARTVRTDSLTAANLRRVLDVCEAERADLLIARSTDTTLATIRVAQEAGLNLMDILMCWVRDLSQPVETVGIDLNVRECEPGDVDQVRSVARRAYSSYPGHYHADPRLDPALCDETYADWAARSCGPDSSARAFVAGSGGRIAGFASVRIRDDGDGEGVLSGVDPDFRGRGFFQALHARRTAWCRELGAPRLWCVTRAANVASQRVYLKVGFRPSHALYVFHKWFDQRADS